MKRIVFSVSNDLVNDQRMIRIASSLANAGYEVTLMGRKLKKSPPLRSQNFIQKRLSLFFVHGKLFYLELNIRFFFYLLIHRADVFCAIDLDTMLPNWAVARLRKKKLVYDAHEYFTEVPEVMHRPLTKSIWEWVGRTCVPKADLCYTVSFSLAEELTRLYGRKFFVVRNMPLLSDTLPVQKSGREDKFILYQGALNEGRGLEQLIEAMKQLPLKLLIAGEGDLSQTLRNQVAEAGLSEKIIFLGKLTPEELKQLTPQAWLGYNLLETESKSYYFSLSNKFFDYIHAGVPGISNPLPEYERITAEYKVAELIHLSPENIVICVRNLLQQATVYHFMTSECRKASSHLNWQEEEKELLNLYARL